LAIKQSVLVNPVCKSGIEKLQDQRQNADEQAQGRKVFRIELCEPRAFYFFEKANVFKLADSPYYKKNCNYPKSEIG